MLEKVKGEEGGSSFGLEERVGLSGLILGVSVSQCPFGKSKM